MADWSTALPDWQERILAGRSLVPDLPLFEDQAAKGLRVFKRLRVPDLPGTPTLAEACGAWFLPLVEALFGSLDPVSRERMIQEYFLLVPKGNSKTSYGGALMIAALIMNERPNAEFHLIAPTIKIAEYAFGQGEGTIKLDPELKKLFQLQAHIRTITHRTTGAKLMIKAADTDVVTGGKQVGTFIDETHELAKKSRAAQIFVELRGALGKRPDGFLIQATTQSKEPPVGVFKEELQRARDVRDGKVKLPMLPILYELPDSVARDNGWRDPKYWPLVNPNFGLSVNATFLETQIAMAERQGMAQMALIASQHFNVEIGVGLRTDRWAGAEFWERQGDPSITFERMLEECEVIVPGIDGGGLDDLFGLAMLGRHRESKDWWLWSHAWCHRGVLDRRKSIAAALADFEAAGELTIVDDELDDMTEIVALVQRVVDAGLLAAVAIDTEGPYGEFVDALAAIGVTAEEKMIVGVRQGIFLMNAIKTAERKLANGTLKHSASGLMAWCVGNAKIEATATAMRATKQNAGDAKIDPWTAMLDAVSLMTTNPEPSGGGPSVYEERDVLVV